MTEVWIGCMCAREKERVDRQAGRKEGRGGGREREREEEDEEDECIITL